MSRGDTILAVDVDQFIGTITLKRVELTSGSPFYDRPDVAGFGQFAVRPSHQHRGIGSALLSLVEGLAREKNVKTLALDTSEHASELIALYESKGYRFVEHVQWPDVNYRSRMFAKAL
jgi:GNAT superfamily N-acetyltransferase